MLVSVAIKLPELKSLLLLDTDVFGIEGAEECSLVSSIVWGVFLLGLDVSWSEIIFPILLKENTLAMLVKLVVEAERCRFLSDGWKFWEDFGVSMDDFLPVSFA